MIEIDMKIHLLLAQNFQKMMKLILALLKPVSGNLNLFRILSIYLKSYDCLIFRIHSQSKKCQKNFKFDLRLMSPQNSKLVRKI